MPQNSYYGDNNETPTMPATWLAEHHFLANPAARRLARRNTRCYWRQSSPETTRQGNLVCGTMEARHPTVVTICLGASYSDRPCCEGLQSILYYRNYLI